MHFLLETFRRLAGVSQSGAILFRKAIRSAITSHTNKFPSVNYTYLFYF